ncbi:HAD-IIB family hydrolase [Flavimaricola marinus]|uniref:Putative mannosyl-3-phosphoglycerate phosphatase n=1 Tax=Flavimaricola marinus TaxID=1819565 RepID=A0A238LL32_9RHOB|nr:HAD hydrolase family protein [Flavimaricola marinus]SMY10104.1 Putative mannosyl-3-phosphoglycerate phosphatase [Flavimaricola marinus]
MIIFTAEAPKLILRPVPDPPKLLSMKTIYPLVVFTDLDGTLLDHQTYDWRPAAPALARLAEINAVVVLASSKTASEIKVLQKEMRLSHWPAIVENGSGIAGSQSPEEYRKLRHQLNSVTPELRNYFCGFGDMPPEEVADRTGLSLEKARLAKERRFSEPGVWSGTAEQEAAFENALSKIGISARRGGRFLTLSYGKTKADQMAEILKSHPARNCIALGDAPNDIEMIRSADYGIIISNPHHPSLPTLEEEATGRVLRTREPGPYGWNSAVMMLLIKLGI